MTTHQVDIHPGKVIKSHILEPLNLSVIELAKSINVPPNRLYLIIKGDRDISVDTAVRLATFLDMEPEFWLNLQMSYELNQFQQSNPKIKDQIKPLRRK